MTYYETTTDGSAPLTQAISFIETGLAAHTNWLFVKEVAFTQTPLSLVLNPGLSPAPVSTHTARIWKCKGSGNTGGQDFYLYLVKQTVETTNNVLHIRLSEGYNTSTDQVIRPAPGLSVTAGVPVVDQTDFSIGNGTGYALTLGNTVQGYQMRSTVFTSALGVGQASTTVYDHFLVVSASFVAYGSNASGVALGGFYVGNFDPSYSPIYNPVAAIVVGLEGGATRFPGYSATNTAVDADALLIPATYPNGFLTTLAYKERFLNRIEAAAVLVTSKNAKTTGATLAANLRGGLRGALPTSVALQVVEGVTPRNGDYFNVGSTEYFRIGSSTAASYPQSISGATDSLWVSKTATY